MELLIIWTLFGIASGFIAANKGRSGMAWGALGLIGGIFALVAICAVPAVKAEPVTNGAE